MGRSPESSICGRRVKWLAGPSQPWGALHGVTPLHPQSEITPPSCSFAGTRDPPPWGGRGETLVP